MNCNCAERIKAELPGIEPSAGHDYIDEVLGLLRVARMRESMEADNGAKLQKKIGELRSELELLKEELKTARRAQPRRYA